MDLPCVRSWSDHGGPLPIIFNTLPVKVSNEKAERERTLYKIFMHMWYTRVTTDTYDRLTHRCDTTPR